MNEPVVGAAEAPPSIATVRVNYLTRRAALSAAKVEGGRLTLFVPTQTQVSPKQLLRLQLAFGDSTRSFELTATALSWTHAANQWSPLGCTVGFFGDDKRRAAEMLAYCANRPASMGTAKRERLSVNVPCKVKMKSHRVKGTITDLSRSGAFVASGELKGVEPGSVVQLALPGGLFGLRSAWLEGRVIWRGEKGGRSGFGVRFVDHAGQSGVALKRYLGE